MRCLNSRAPFGKMRAVHMNIAAQEEKTFLFPVERLLRFVLMAARPGPEP
jgi:hypothetical protein